MPNSAQPAADPLRDPTFRPPGLRERLRCWLQGATRPLDCLQVGVTSVCPGRCSYCPHTTRAADWESRHMPDTVFAALWPLLRRSARAHLQGWGEPLLHPRFLDFVALARRAGCQVSSTTCGLRMDEALAAGIAASGMDTLAFSLAGTDPASNDARAGVPFERVRAAVGLMNDAIRRAPRRGAPPLSVHLAYLMLADRVDAVKGLPDLMEEWDVRVAVVSTLDYIAGDGHEALAFSPREKEKLARARAVLGEAEGRAAARGRRIFHELPEALPGQVRGGCRENAARTLYVEADGTLSPCVYVNVPFRGGQPRRRVYGSAVDGDPWAIWNGADCRAFRETLARGKAEPCCGPCPKRFEG